ncbi:hypothetical protein ACFO4E_03750 [Nocardiopsis mangrovi]|uniref:Uncharacterized protein n=1 Tax=Nocardiopsis mangrovi TaxID=1179818 RepID=A0ABV9DTN3_9ACTN
MIDNYGLSEVDAGGIAWRRAVTQPWPGATAVITKVIAVSWGPDGIGKVAAGHARSRGVAGEGWVRPKGPAVAGRHCSVDDGRVSAGFTAESAPHVDGDVVARLTGTSAVGAS